MKESTKKNRYAIFLQIDDNEWDYLRKKEGATSWQTTDPVRLFDTKEEADKECQNWNTGSVVMYQYSR